MAYFRLMTETQIERELERADRLQQEALKLNRADDAKDPMAEGKWLIADCKTREANAIKDRCNEHRQLREAHARRGTSGDTQTNAGGVPPHRSRGPAPVVKSERGKTTGENQETDAA